MEITAARIRVLKSKYSHLLTLVGALLAFTPIVAVDYLLDTYVRGREKDAAEHYARSVATQIEIGANDAIASLQRILATSPSLCTPTFVALVQQEIQNSLNMKQVLVENADGVQYCDAFGGNVAYSLLSPSLPIPGQVPTLAIAKFGQLSMATIKVTQTAGETRLVSAFVPLVGNTSLGIAKGLALPAMLRVQLTNATTVLEVGDTSAFERRSAGDEYIYAQALAGELPLRVEYAIPFSAVRAGYADLDIGCTMLAGLMSAAFLILALNYVRRSRVPAFDLERAVARGEIKPYYQPVINLRTGELMGCEVLCRWEKKNGQVVPPGAFIDYAEETGLAIPMTLSLMQQVKFDLGDLSEIMPNLKISINLFEGHFRDGGIVEDVQAIFGNSKIDLRQLVFEITERHPLGNSAVAGSVIAGLHALGCKLALDDAGTGHSNLAYIGTLGCDVIKIDRIFVDMVKPGTAQVPVLDALIAMATDLDCEIVAEGVETEEQALYLRARGVIQAQGFIFAPALKVGAFRDLAMALHATYQASGGQQLPVADAA